LRNFTKAIIKSDILYNAGDILNVTITGRDGDNLIVTPQTKNDITGLS